MIDTINKVMGNHESGAKTSLSQRMNSIIEKDIEEKKDHGPLKLLMLSALGVVFGDIGTSPLYTMKESFVVTGQIVSPDSVYRFLSMIFWLLFIVVSTKYVTFVMKAHNKGEGGDFALLALVQRLTRPNPKLFKTMCMLGIAAGSLFYADAVITPAISVLSAVEGLEVVSPSLAHFVMPITLIIIISLFSVQRLGTSKVGNVFGPVMFLWFSTLGILGTIQIFNFPEVLKAVNPYYALQFIFTEPAMAFTAMSAVVLGITGAEALYADMGHFGAKPIKMTWFYFVWPCLILNYFGQGALLLTNPQAIENPFFFMAPKPLIIALVVLASFATIIASQAVISGTFSLTRQAIHLGYLPRMRIMHTSDREMGQIYMPFINGLLMFCVLLVVLVFRSSTGLAGAYGLAVTGAMAIASISVGVVMRLKWNWSMWKVGLTIGFFLIIDLSLFVSTLTKFFTGGYIPVFIALCLFSILTTWKKGVEIIEDKLERTTISVDNFIKDIDRSPPIRVPGTAIYMTPRHNVVPSSLLYNIKHNKILHERVIFLTVIPQDFPHIALEDSVHIYSLGADIYRLDVLVGFKDIPDVTAALEYCHEVGMDFDTVSQTSFFVCRETILPVNDGQGMAFWREHLFSVLKNNSSGPVTYYRLPANRVCELGTAYEM